jgi:hypothetical protein
MFLQVLSCTNTESFDYFLFIKPVYEMSFDLFLCPIHTSIYSTIIEYDLNNELLFLIEMYYAKKKDSFLFQISTTNSKQKKIT